MMKHYLYDIIKGDRKGFIPEIVKIGLWFLSLIYRLVSRSRNILFDKGVLSSCQLDRSVISVGNIVLGGAGKTPLVHWIAQRVKAVQKVPVVLTRGYMPDKNIVNIIESDEALMLSQQLSDVEILVGADRAYSAQEYLRENAADVFIMDDGFQHRKLNRDLEIVIIDATNPWGNGFVFPRGILREPPSALKRADIIVLTRVDIGSGNVEMIREKVSDICGEKLIIETIHEPSNLTDLITGEDYELSFLEGKEVCAFCSIGNPEAFSETIKGMGAKLKESVRFLDHYSYEEKDIDSVIDVCLANHIEVAVTTQKDAVKITHLLKKFKGKLKLVCLDVNIQVTEGRDDFIERINSLL